MTDETSPSDLYGHAPAVGPDLNQTSNHNEAGLVQGIQTGHTADAIAASGSDQHANEAAASHFAQRAAAAISNGRPLSELPADPNLSQAAQQAIYEQVAQQQGTSSHAIEEKAQQAKANDMAAVQGMMGGLLGVAAVETVGHDPVVVAAAAERHSFGKIVLEDHERPLDENGRPLSTGAVMAALGADFPKTQGLPNEKQMSIGQGFARS